MVSGQSERRRPPKYQPSRTRNPFQSNKLPNSKTLSSAATVSVSVSESQTLTNTNTTLSSHQPHSPFYKTLISPLISSHLFPSSDPPLYSLFPIYHIPNSWLNFPHSKEWVFDWVKGSRCWKLNYPQRLPHTLLLR